MASAPRFTPEERARLRALRPEDSPDARRARRLLAWLVALSLLLHVSLLGLSGWLGLRRPAPELAQDAPPVQVQFVESAPESEGEPPPDTPFRSSADSRAESPEPTPPPEPAPENLPRSLGESPVLERPRPAPRRAAPPEPPAPAAEPGEEQPVEEQPGVGIAQETSEEKRKRLAQGLRGIGGVEQSWEDAATSAPDIPGGAFGGSSLMFESKADVDWGPYAEQIKRIVRSNWRIAPAAEYLSGVVQVHFYIRRDGTIEELVYTSRAEIDPLDIPAYDAIRLSDPLPKPPLPEDLDEERVGVTWSFLYNVDEREYRQWQRVQRWNSRRR